MFASVDNRFAPVLSSTSEKIDRRLSERRGNVPRWEYLYKLGERGDEMLECKQRAKEEDIERQRQEQFPFRPVLASKAGNSRTPSKDGSTRKKPQKQRQPRGDSVEKRTQQWIEQRNLKVSAMAAARKAKELDGCTFQPMICSRDEPEPQNSPRWLGDSELKAVQRHIEMQFHARKDREDIRQGHKPSLSPRSAAMNLSVMRSQEETAAADNNLGPKESDSLLSKVYGGSRGDR